MWYVFMCSDSRTEEKDEGGEEDEQEEGEK